jgi:Mg/Co/Ni transporter MgtE
LPEVHEYRGAKMDWLAHGFEYEGDADLVGRHLHTDVQTCHLEERVGAVAERVGDATLCAAVSKDGVVLGALGTRELHEQADHLVATVARRAPSTVRPSEERSALEERMLRKNVAAVLVTDPTGHLLGRFER